MTTLLLFILGIASGVVLGFLFSRVGVAYKSWPYALLLVAAAATYPLMDLTSALPVGAGQQLPSWGGLVIFGLIAAAGMKWSPWWIALGLLTHSMFDLGLAATTVCNELFCSGSYAPWCAGLDLIVGVLFIFRVCVTPEPRLSR